MHILTPKLNQAKNKTQESVALDTQTSIQSGAHCEIKSKFFKNWTDRQIFVDLEEQLLYIICEEIGRKKSYNLNQVSYSRDTHKNIIKLRVCPNRSYEVKSNTLLQQVLKDIDYYQSCRKMLPETYELKAPQPRKIDYQRSMEKPHKQQREVKMLVIEPRTPKQVKVENQQKKRVHEYEREPSYIKELDWRRDQKNGGLLLINKQKKSLIPKMISYSAKKLLSSGSFANINFPTFAMKPESNLETFCKSLGSAPLLLDGVDNSPLERMKAFNAVLLTMSLLTNDIEKPFTSVLGETFQAQIGGNHIYAEQISIKPDITSFLLVGHHYKLFGNLELKANVGLNDAVGVFYGNVTLEFDDGARITGIMPKGIMTGVIFGDTCFGPTGSVYTYDAGNRLVCSFETKKGDVMTGQIGRLKQSALQKFEKNIRQKSVEQFPHVNEKEYETILSKMQVVYTDSISYDGKTYFSYGNKQNLPIKMTKNIKNEQVLLSDSSFREDIRLRKLNNIKDSQTHNDQIEREEERLRNLRKSDLRKP